MIQRMLNKVTINVPDISLYAVYNIEVTLEQRSSCAEFTYGAENIEMAGEHTLVVTVPKEDAMKLLDKPIRYQVMYMEDGFPKATKIYRMPVDELLKDDGYGE